MKVKDLIEALKECEETAEIVIGVESEIIEDIRIERTWDDKVLICDYTYYDDADSIEAIHIKEENGTGIKVKQINNLTIKYTELYQYSVWTPDGKCWEDRLTLEQATEFCENNRDFVKEA